MTILLLSSVACTTERLRERWEGWYDEGSELDVEEPLAFTDVNYDFTGATPIADIPTPAPDSFETWFASDDPPAAGCVDWLTVDDLPVEVEGVVTLHPRQYIKVSGCRPEGDNGVDSDEKYYGSYFVQDQSGGYFVLGDSKVARFDMGDRVTMRVRAVKEYFGMTMISAHDIVEVSRGPQPIYYERVDGRLLARADVGKTVRIEGLVAAPLGGFGEVYLCAGDAPDTTLVETDREDVPACYLERTDEAPAFKVGLDVELQRRGVEPEAGTRYAVTGPVIYSFNEEQVNVMRIGQLEPLAE
ncbi:MAG: hypothetical protein AAF602_06780 [Myxococcota bacterium]